MSVVVDRGHTGLALPVPAPRDRLARRLGDPQLEDIRTVVVTDRVHQQLAAIDH